MIHRDLKPENVFLLSGPKLRTKILDFGLARLKFTGDAEAPVARITLAGAALGTPDYMAPGQQVDAASADGRADLYSVAVMRYEMLTGRLPRGRFKAPSELRPDVPREFDEVVLHGLNHDPADRPGSAAEYLEAVRQLASAGRSAAPRQPAPSTRTALSAAIHPGPDCALGSSEAVVLREERDEARSELASPRCARASASSRSSSRRSAARTGTPTGSS